MKRFLSIFLTVCLIGCMASISFAAGVGLDLTNDAYNPFLVDNENNNTFLGELPTSALAADARTYMQNFFSVMTGDTVSNQNLSVILGVNDTGVAYLYFATHASKPYYYMASNKSAYRYYTGAYSAVRFSFSPSVKWVVMDGGSLKSWSGTEFQCLYPTSVLNGLPPSVTSYFCLWSNCKIAYQDGSEPFAAVNLSGSLGFVDDDGLLTPKTDPEPSSSEVPSSSTPSAGIPDIPTGNKYVCYDTVSTWTAFLEYFYENLYPLVVVGIKIFAILFGLGLITKIINHFRKV